METVVLIPAYKPNEKLISLTDSLLELKRFRIVIVNDGSGNPYDGIFEKLKEKAIVLVHPQNKGKGAALKTGISYVKDNLPSCGYIVTADADGQHSVEDILKLADEVEHIGGFVLGVRRFTGKVPLRSRLGNSITRFVFSAVSGVKVSDTQTGLRAFDASLFSFMTEINGDRYEYETNVLLQAAKSKIKINEVEIHTIYEGKNESSHFNPLWDSIRIYLKIFKYSVSALLSFALDFTLFTLFSYLFNLPLWLSITAARIISATFNFTLNRFVVFKSKNGVFRELIQYSLLATLILLLNIGITKLFVSYIGIEKWVAKLITETILFILSFIAQDKIIFRLKNKKKSER